MAGFVSYADAAGQARALAALVAGELATALAARDRCLLAVPGGRTPGPFLAGLTGAALDWDRVTVLATDERIVPETSPRSNTGQLRAAFATCGSSEKRRSARSAGRRSRCDPRTYTCGPWSSSTSVR